MDAENPAGPEAELEATIDRRIAATLEDPNSALSERVEAIARREVTEALTALRDAFAARKPERSWP